MGKNRKRRSLASVSTKSFNTRIHPGDELDGFIFPLEGDRFF
ncbi:hypothetical protein [Laspinema olomoucense]|nr:hypothetical protein [Laspinema sp. D3c]